jgi:hypothetical protein
MDKLGQMITEKIYRTLDAHSIQLSVEEVYDAMGGAGEPNAELDREVESMISELRGLMIPHFLFYRVDGSVDLDSATLTLGGVDFSVGKIIARQLRRSQSFAVFVATAGAEYDAWAHALGEEGDMLRTVIADCLGTIVAEKAADAMELALQQSIDSVGWLHTNRYSPGYCGWHVSEQQKLFSLMPDERPCGVTLTDSSLMLPIKSVSGVIGVGPDVKKMDYTCGLCSFADCFRRKKR